LLAAGAGTFWWIRSHQPRFTGDGNVVLAEFTNSTGDAVFDMTLREGLATYLQQSPNVGVVSEARIAQAMKLMMQPKDARLTPALAREVCQRTGSAASIEGSIASLGRQYVLDLKALNCKSGDILARVQETAEGKEQVLHALGVAAGKLRSRLGESLPSQQRDDPSALNVSTGSLEALEAYDLGIKAQSAGDCASAVIHYKRAIALDPNFAMAYGRLGICVGSGPEGEGYYRKAYLLRDRVSEREQFYLASHYEQYVTGDLEATRKLMETWIETYPHDADAPPNLLKLYLTTGEYEKAWPLVQKLVQESPGTPANNAMRMSTTLLFLNRIDEAKAILVDAVAHHFDTPVVHFYLYEIDFLKGDEAGMAVEVAYLRTQPAWANNILDLESFSAAYKGQFRKARSLSDMAIERLNHDGDAAGAGAFLAEMSLEEALAGNSALAQEKARKSLLLSKEKDAEPNAGIALALAGDSAGATRIALDLDKRFPSDTIIQSSITIMRAALLVNVGRSPEDARKALEELSGISRYDLGSAFFLVPIYLRGRAHLETGDPAKAAAEFQRILDHGRRNGQGAGGLFPVFRSLEGRGSGPARVAASQSFPGAPQSGSRQALA
jgi:tetratricopeptide (TPR) repeat protein